VADSVDSNDPGNSVDSGATEPASASEPASVPEPASATDPASAAAQVFVDDLETCEPSPRDAHHLTRVLRLRPGEKVIASDGRGSWRVCLYTGSDRVMEPASVVETVARRTPEVTIAFAPAKGDRPEWVVQKLVEIGVDRLVVLRTARSVVVWEGHRADHALDRLRKIATEAASQSRRTWIPQIEGVIPVVEFAATRRLALAERGGAPLDSLGIAALTTTVADASATHAAAPTTGGPAATGSPGTEPARPIAAMWPICIGPEGGWTEAELQCASVTVGLSDGVLRSETAAVVAGALACALRDHGVSL
jgi:16S rRNA (uracil1498-N3)-methyltransferase